MISTFRRLQIMKTLMLALVLSIFVAGCTSTGTMRQIDTTKPRSVFIEPIEPDTYELMKSAEIALGRKGYDAVKDESRASFRFKTALFHHRTEMTVTSRLVDAASGDVVYFGEGKNYGFGTVIDSRGAIFRCLDSSLDNLK